MTLTLGVTLAVLGAALLHAGWNALVKKSGDPLLETALINVMAGVAAIPVLVFVPLPDAAAWPYLATSVALHVGYFFALVGTYRAGDLSYSYPLMRGLAPLLAALGALAWLGEAPTPAGWGGIALISAGVLSIGLIGHRWLPNDRAATAWALVNALIIACYTVVDGAGVRLAGGAERYVLWIFLLDAVPFTLIVLWMRGPQFGLYVARHWRRGLAGGIAAATAYGIALWAMTLAPVATVAALRETSVVFATLIGIYLLNEPRLKRRLGGALAVAAGIVVLKI